MKFETCIKESFVVIGKEGSTNNGEGFIQKLWEDANSNFGEVADIAKKNSDGSLVGVWGAMSDFSRAFLPWQNGFSEGLYLAGVECRSDADAPTGWTKWVIPAYEYLYCENESASTFASAIDYMQENNMALAGAAHDFICPKTGKSYVFFPIRSL